jgi:hypothetical protein
MLSERGIIISLSLNPSAIRERALKKSFSSMRK